MNKIYLDLREQAFSITPEAINICLENEKQVYAAVVDIHVKDKLITLFCSFDGTVSLYYDTGKCNIGLGMNKDIKRAAMSFLVSSGQCLEFMNLMKSNEIDKSDMHVYLFNSEGIKEKKINFNNFQKKEEKFLNFLVQNVITTIRSIQ